MSAERAAAAFLTHRLSFPLGLFTLHPSASLRRLYALRHHFFVMACEKSAQPVDSGYVNLALPLQVLSDMAVRLFRRLQQAHIRSSAQKRIPV